MREYFYSNRSLTWHQIGGRVPNSQQRQKNPANSIASSRLSRRCSSWKRTGINPLGLDKITSQTSWILRFAVVGLCTLVAVPSIAQISRTGPNRTQEAVQLDRSIGLIRQATAVRWDTRTIRASRNSSGSGEHVALISTVAVPRQMSQVDMRGTVKGYFGIGGGEGNGVPWP